MSLNLLPQVTSAQTDVNTWKKLSREWAAILGIIFSPSILILIVVTILLIYFSLTAPEGSQVPPHIAAITTVMISIFSGLVGASISSRLSKLTEWSILVPRGKSAIRGLKLLLHNLSATERRVRMYHGLTDEKNSGRTLFAIGYDEIIDRCNSLQEEVINAIEEWQDIIPEANLKTQIGVISQLRADQLELAEENKRLGSLMKKSHGDNEDLKCQFSDNSQKLVEVERKLRDHQIRFNTTVLGGTGLGGPIFQPTMSGRVAVLSGPSGLNGCQPVPPIAAAVSSGSPSTVECQIYSKTPKLSQIQKVPVEDSKAPSLTV